LPKIGFKSLTVPSETYDWWYSVYLTNRKEYRKKGIMNFSNFVQDKLYSVMKREENKK